MLLSISKKIMTKIHNILMIWRDKSSKRKVYGAEKPINIWDVNIDNIVISKLVETKTNSKYLTRYLDRFVRSLVLVLPKLSGYAEAFKFEDKRNKLMSSRIDHEALLEKYKTIWAKIEDLKNTELNALPVYDNRHIETKIRPYGGKVYTNFRGLNVPEDDIECKSFSVLPIDSLFAYGSKYYL